MLRSFLLLASVLCFAQVAHADLKFSKTTIVTGASSSNASLIAHDIDGANGDDLILVSGSTFEVFLNDGAGGFAAPVSTASTATGMTRACIADVDGVNGDDVVAVNQANDEIVVFINGGATTFTPNYYTAGGGSAPSRIACADVDGANGVDVVATGAELYVLFNDGDGTFDTTVDTYDVAGATGSDLTLLDMGGTAEPEIVVGTTDSSTYEALTVFSNDGAGNFTTHDGSGGALAYDYTLAAGQVPAAAMALQDVDGLNGDDIVFVSPSNNTISFALNDGAGGLTTPSTDYPAGSDLRQIVSADIDTVLGNDLIAVDGANNRIWLLLDKGDGTFGYKQKITVGDSPQAVAVLDLDSDGMNDIFTYDASDSTISILTNTTDLVPKAITFTDDDEAELSTSYRSSFEIVVGIDARTTISIANGEYRLLAGGTRSAWTSSPGLVEPYQFVELRRTSSASYSTAEVVTLTVGGVVATYTVTTKDDTEPDAFDFTDAVNVNLSTLTASDIQSVTGLAVPTPISVSGGEYQTSSGGVPIIAWTSAPGTINNGEDVQVRRTSAATFDTTKTVVLTVGESVVDFAVTTRGDDVPNAFAFTDATDVEPSALVVSDLISIKGISTSVPVSVSGTAGSPEYKKNSGAWTSVAGTIKNGDFIQVRGIASASYATALDVTLDVNGASDTFTITTKGDVDPDAFDFTDAVDVNLSTLTASDIQAVTGLGVATPISVSGGEYQTSSGGVPIIAWTSAPGTINNGEDVQVRLTSSASFDTTDTAVLTVGDTTVDFAVTTRADDVAKAFAFEDVTGAQLSDVVSSDFISVLGITTSVPISVSGTAGSPQYKKNGGAWTSVAGTVKNGDVVWVRGTSSASYSTGLDVTLDINGVSDTFTITTKDDVDPDAFDFTDATGVALSTLSTSNIQAVTGLGVATPISVSGGEYQTSSGGVPVIAWTSLPGTINNGEDVQVRRTSSASFDTTTTVVLTVGDTDVDYAVTTISDNVPDAFTFVDQTGVALSSVVVAEHIIVKGMSSPAPVSISGTAVSPQWRKNFGTWNSGAGTVKVNDIVQVRGTSSGSYSTALDVTLNINGVSDTFTMTTQDDTDPDAFDFTDDTNVNLSTLTASDIQAVTGLGVATPISVSGGEYQTSSGGVPVIAWTSLPGTINNGEDVQVRLTSSAEFDTTDTVVLTVGSTNVDYKVTTRADDIAKSFAFTDVTDVEPSELVESDFISVLGITTSVPVSVSGTAGSPEYKKNGGAWTSVAGTVKNGDVVRVRGIASAGYSTALDVTLDINGVSDTFTMTTKGDVDPDAFDFTDAVDVNLSTLTASDIQAVTGLGVATPISVSGGEYQTSSGGVPVIAWTSLPGTINNGEDVQVRMTSSASFDTTDTVVLTIGDTAVDFAVSTRADDVAKAFTFNDVSGAELSEVVTSNFISVLGLTTTVPVSVSGTAGSPEYKKNGGAWTSVAGTVKNGDVIYVRGTSSAAYSTGLDVTLDINGVSDTFTITTKDDVDPDAFDFTDSTGVALSTLSTSDIQAVTGLGVATPISVSGGEYQTSSGGVPVIAWTTLPGTINNGEDVQVRRTSAASFDTTNTVVLTIGDTQVDYDVTTISDDVPDAFAFVDQTGVGLSALATSDYVVIKGLSSPAPVSVSGTAIGPQWRKNFGSWTSAAGTVKNTDVVQVRGTASASYSTALDVTLDINGVSDTFTMTTQDDIDPDAFDFTDDTNVNLSTLTASDIQAVTGLGVAAPISVVGGEYQTSSGGVPVIAWTSLPGTINNGEDVQVRLTSSANFDTTDTVVLTVGSANVDYKVTTRADDIPKAFAFTDATGAQLSEVVSSNFISVLGITTSVPISVSGTAGSPEYKKNGGAWTNVAGTVKNGDIVWVRGIASAGYSTGLDVTLDINGVSDTFTITTKDDVDPDAFDFTDSTGVALSTLSTSDIQAVTGLGVATPISVSGGEYQTSSGGVPVIAWTTLPGTINNGEDVQVRRTSAASFDTTNTVVLTIGDTQVDYDVTTISDDVPDAFAFVDQTGVGLSALATSDYVVIKGLSSPAPVSVSGTAIGPQWRKNFGSWTSAAGTVKNTDVVQVRGTASASYSTALDVTLDINGVSDTFTMTTQDDIDPDAFDFTDDTNVNLSTLTASDIQAVTGLGVATPISVVGGEYQTSSGGVPVIAWTSTPGTINNGEDVQVRLTSSANFDTTDTAVLTVGTTEVDFAVTTRADDIPKAFAFTDTSGVDPSSLVESDFISVLGVTTSVPISVSGTAGSPEYKKNGGAWTSGAGTAKNGDLIRVRGIASASYTTALDVTLDVNGVSDTFTITTKDDTDPDAFDFTDATNVNLLTLTASDIQAVTGLGVATPITVSGGEYQTSSGGVPVIAWTSTPGTINNGEDVQVRLTSSADFDTTDTVVLTIGETDVDFAVTTRPDDVAKAFAFNDASGAELSEVVTSNFISVLGLTTTVPISVSGTAGSPEYKKNGGAWTNVAGTAKNGDVIYVRGISSASYSSSLDVTLDVNGVSDTFTITTKDDTDPDAFDFTDAVNVDPSTLTASDIQAVTGLAVATPISVSGGEYQTSSGGVPVIAWTSTPGTINNGEDVQVRRTSAPNFDTTKTVVLTIGDTSVDFAVTTRPNDVPNAFAFTDTSGVDPSELVASGYISVLGITTSVPISVSGTAGSPEYKKNGGAWTNVAGTAKNGDLIQVRGIASASYSTGLDVTLDVNGVSDTFTITTKDDTDPDAFDFTDATNVNLSTLTASDIQAVTGLAVATPILVSGGEYQTSSGGVPVIAWTSAPGTINNGEDVQVRRTSSASFDTTDTVVLTIGDTAVDFAVTTRPDDVVKAFAFTDATGADLSELVVSDYISVLGVTTTVPISVSGTAGSPEYKKNGGAWTSVAGTAKNGDLIQVRGIASASYSTALDVTLDVNGVSDTFTITTKDDTDPDAFDFTDATNVNLSTLTASDIQAVTGLAVATPISVSGGEYQTSSGGVPVIAWTSAPGTINNGEDVQVRRTSSASFDTTSLVLLTIGDTDVDFAVTTRPDDVAKAFVFNDVTGVDPSELVTSNFISVLGLTTSVPISVSGTAGSPEYKKNGGAWTNVAGTTKNGDVIYVRGIASASYSTALDVTLDINGVSDTFTITTKGDVDPDAFDFTDATNVNLSTLTASDIQAVTGLGVATPISVSGGEYQTSSGGVPVIAWTSLPGTINNGEDVQVRRTSSANFDTTETVVLTVGETEVDFAVTTRPDDVVKAFAFTDTGGAELSELVASNYISVLGVTTTVPISVSGTAGTPEYKKNGGAWTSVAGTAKNGDVIQVRGIASASYSTALDVTLDVNGVSDTFTITTKDDTDPDAFDFTDATNVNLSTLTASDIQAVTGLAVATPISVSGGEYQTSSGGVPVIAWTSLPGTINNGEDVQVRRTSSASFDTTDTVVLTIGDTDVDFAVTTRPDDVAKAFVFADTSGAELSETVASNLISVLGITTTVPISVSGTAGTPEYKKNGETWTSAAGTAKNGDVIQVRGIASASYSTALDVTLDINGVSDTFTITTKDDTDPDAFDFTDATNVNLSTLTTSDIQAVTGLAVATPISVSGGEYQTSSGGVPVIAWTSLPGTINNGEDVQVRRTSSASFDTTDTVVLTIGDTDVDYSMTTRPDDVAKAFAFNDTSGVDPSEVVSSNLISVLGITTTVPISVSGTAGTPEYKKNGGAWTNVAGTAKNGDVIQVRGIASASYSTALDVTLDVNGVSDTFTITTKDDTDPDPFDFTDSLDVNLSTLTASDQPAVNGLGVPTPISVVGGEYQIIGGAGWTTAAGTILNGQQVQVRRTSAATFDTNSEVVLTIGETEINYIVRTRADDVAKAFAFTDVTGVNPSELVTSNLVSVLGITTTVPISVSGTAGTPEYKKNGEAWTSAAGTAKNGDIIQVRGFASGSYTTTLDVTLDVNGVSDTFTITTKDDTDPDPFDFTDAVDVNLSTLTTSDAPTVTGLSVAAPISVSGGEYQTASGGVPVIAWTSLPGTINNGETVEVRRVSSASFDTTDTVVLTIDETEVDFAVSTRADDVAKAFAFTDAVGVDPSELVVSSYISVLGITTTVPISVAGTAGSPEYKKNGEAWTSAPGTAKNGDVIQVRGIASASYSSALDVTLDVNGVSDTFTMTTHADIDPNAFDFIDVTGVTRSTLSTSAPVSITGISAPAPISVKGGEYQIGVSGWTTLPGTVNNGENVQVRLTSSSKFSTTKNATVTVGNQSGVYSVTTELDNIAKAFAFDDKSDQPISTVIESDPIYVLGLETAATISVVGGEYSINGGAYTAAAGLVNFMDAVRVRGTSSASYLTPVDVTLTISDKVDTFTITTTEDIVPNAFAFTAVPSATRSTQYISNQITVGGLGAAVNAPISISGGSYRINGGAFTTSNGTVTNGDLVEVEVISSSQFSTLKSGVLTIGNSAINTAEVASFDVTTELDYIANAFTIFDVNDADLGTVVVSAPIGVTGLETGATISIAGDPSAQYSINGGAYNSGASLVNNLDLVRIRVIAASTYDTPVDAILTISDKSDTFTVRTVADIFPDPFSFSAVTNWPENSLVESEVITITGLGVCTPIQVYGYPGSQYRINGGAYTTSNGCISNGDSLQVAVMSSKASKAKTYAEVKVGDTTARFNVVTEAANLKMGGGDHIMNYKKTSKNDDYELFGSWFYLNLLLGGAWIIRRRKFR